jgi:hypothetical protein
MILNMIRPHDAFLQAFESTATPRRLASSSQLHSRSLPLLRTLQHALTRHRVSILSSIRFHTPL